MDVVSDASSGQARIKPAAQERIETVASLAEGWAAASECVSEVHAGHHSRQGQRLHRVLSVLGASEQRAHHCRLPAQRALTKDALRAPPPRGPGGSGFAAGPTGLPNLPRPRRHDLGDRRWGLCRPGGPPPVGPPWPMLPRSRRRAGFQASNHPDGAQPCHCLVQPAQVRIPPTTERAGPSVHSAHSGPSLEPIGAGICDRPSPPAPKASRLGASDGSLTSGVVLEPDPLIS